MELKDYSKYYIQGSDHYLIHKDIFKELFNEMVSWREESIELKKQLKEKEKLIEQCNLSVSNMMDCYYERTDCGGRIKDSKVYDSLVQKVEIQQKEFIKYLENKITELLKEYGNYVYDDYSEEQGKYDTYIEVLQRYKKIIEVEK